MVIRKAKSSDFKRLNELYEQVDYIHRVAHPNIFKTPVYPARSDEFLNSIIENEKKSLLVAENDGLIIGLAKAEINQSPDISLYQKREYMLVSTIIVDEMFRGKGVATVLLESLYDWARENSVEDVELTVFSFNETAAEFYNKKGFKEISRKLVTKI